MAQVDTDHAPFPGLVTTLLVAFDRTGPPARAVERAQDVVLRCGGLDVRIDETPAGPALGAEFHGVCEAVRAAMEIVPETGGAGTARIAIDTTEAGRAGDPRPAERAARLLATTAPGRIRASAATALVAGPALPPGAEFVDAGTRAPGDRRERVYELVVTAGAADDVDGPAPGGADPGGSNLEWARRAAHGAEPPAGDYPQTVAAAWERAVAGRGGALLVGGGTAAGRHAATAALALLLHARGALILHGRWASGADRPYRAFREALGAYAGVRGTEQLIADLDGRIDLCARLVPELGARLASAAPGPLAEPPVPTAAEAFDAVELWLRAIVGRGPAALVLTDAEWAEPASVRLLARLAGVAGRLRLLVLVSGPDEPGADGRGRGSWAGFPAATGSTVQRIELAAD